MASESIRDQWYLEVKGRKSGPYSLAQLKSLVARADARMEDRVTAEHLCGKWIALSELMRKGNDPTIPPRPDEKTLLSLSTPSRTPGADPVDNLFHVVQSSRDRKPAKTVLPAPVQQMEIRSSRSRKRLWALVPVAAAGITAVWGMTQLLHPKPGAKSAVVEPVVSRPALVSSPAVTPQSLSQARFAPAIAAHSAHPAQPVSASASASDNSDQERQREHERQQAESERDRELAELDRDQYLQQLNTANRNPATAPAEPEEEKAPLQADTEQAPSDGSLPPLVDPSQNQMEQTPAASASQ